MKGESEKVWKQIKETIDYAMELILTFEQNGTIQYANHKAREELGYGEELEKENLAAILRIQFQTENFEVKELTDVEETTMYRKNGTCFPVKMQVIVGEPNLLFAINVAKWSEIERKLLRVKEEAEHNKKVRNEFVANVTHELRTPVNGIKGHVDNLLETSLDVQQRRTIEIIQRCCENMSAIINNILDFSKLEAGKFTLEEKKFNFYEMVDQVIETHITTIDDKGLHILVNIGKDVPTYVIGDALRLTQILNNLISNAVKFTSAGYINVEITKTLEFDDEIELFFVISDTGIGIAPEEKDRLFKSFSQVDATITRKYGGTGLGLAIVKELVGLMQGNVYIESEKGKGSSFSFSIRLHGTEEKQTELLEEFKFLNRKQDVSKYESIEDFFRFGTKENAQEIRNKMEKLVICIELAAWEKAEEFAHNIKTLTKQGPKEIEKEVFRLELIVRKENYEKSLEQYERLREILQEAIGGM
ncbi:MAG: ATP-binding protein [Lachnospiraceae bacterium]